MITPVSNATIKGWLWYQGEQNGGNPGSYLNKSGYACLLPALDNAWRHAFTEGSSTDPDFPIGVVSLHGWCGEEEAECTVDPAIRTDWTAKIRWAQHAFLFLFLFLFLAVPWCFFTLLLLLLRSSYTRGH